MHRTQVFAAIRKYTAEFLNKYIQKDEVLTGLDNYIVPPGLGDNAGIVGAIALAVNELS